jgi:hypothetical protein
MEIYTSSCGEHFLCKKWPGMIHYDPHPQLMRCPPCSCKDSCYKQRNCCLDKFYERKAGELITPTVFVADKDVNVRFPLYDLITTCPILATDNEKLLCNYPPLQTKYKGPVTSIATNYSYINEYCAICHEEEKEKIKFWNFSTEGHNEIDIFNFVDSMDMLEKSLENIQMTVIYAPPENLKSLAPSFYHYYSLPMPSCSWDEDLQAGCSSSYINKYRFHRNILCYICSLPERSVIDMNEPLCRKTNLTIYNACVENSFSSLTAPFRNVYCIICNHPPNPQFPYRQAGYWPFGGLIPSMVYVFEDFSAVMDESWLQPLDTPRVYYVRFSSITFNVYSILKTIRNANAKNLSEKIDKENEDSNLHLANIMTITSAVYPWRICNQDKLPEVVQNISRRNCSCSFSCLFQAKCTCCIDTAIQHELQCSSSRKILSPSLYDAKAFDLNFLEVSTCFQNQNRKQNTSHFYDEVKYLCEEQSHTFDLPVVREGVTYKNVFCLICNSDIDIEYDDLSGIEYKILEFNIACFHHFNIVNKINLFEIVQEARDQNCSVILDTKNTVLCKEHPTNITSTCESDTTQQSFRWACENLKEHSLPRVNKYKNEFCELCSKKEHFQLNETYVDEGNYTECNKSNPMHVQYDEACRSLPNVDYHPGIFPHRNIFCSYCAHDEQYKLQTNNSFCEPKFGKRNNLPSILVRRLFFPRSRFDLDVGIKSTEVCSVPAFLYYISSCFWNRLKLMLQAYRVI